MLFSWARSTSCFKPAMTSSALTCSLGERLGPGVAEIVDAFKDDHAFNARLCQDITVEAGEGTDTESNIRVRVVKNAVTADALVENTDWRSAGSPQ